VNTLDNGAISQAFGFAQHVSDSSMNLAYASSTQEMNALATANQQAMQAVSDAYSTAKAGNQKVFTWAALAVVGVVALSVMRKG
jgi:hypothetical protein